MRLLRNSSTETARENHYFQFSLRAESNRKESGDKIHAHKLGLGLPWSPYYRAHEQQEDRYSAANNDR